MKKALFPGSFDPIHDGHISIYKKATELFDEVLVYVTFNPRKNNAENVFERAEKIQAILPEVKVLSGHQMTTDVARQNNCQYIVRGIRNDSDIKYELAMASGNKELNREIESILIISDEELKHVSSSSLKLIDESKQIEEEYK